MRMGKLSSNDVNSGMFLLESIVRSFENRKEESPVVDLDKYEYYEKFILLKSERMKNLRKSIQPFISSVYKSWFSVSDFEGEPEIIEGNHVLLIDSDGLKVSVDKERLKDDGFLNVFCKFLDIAVENCLKVVNKRFWREYLKSKEEALKGMIRFSQEFLPLGLVVDLVSYYSSDVKLEVSSVNGFRKEYLDFVSNLDIDRISQFLTEEEFERYRDAILESVMVDILRCDFSTLVSKLRHPRFLPFKNEIKEYLSWVFSVSPSDFRARVYKNISHVKEVAEFMPDEIADYVAKKIISI